MAYVFDSHLSLEHTLHGVDSEHEPGHFGEPDLERADAVRWSILAQSGARVGLIGRTRLTLPVREADNCTRIRGPGSATVRRTVRTEEDLVGRIVDEAR